MHPCGQFVAQNTVINLLVNKFQYVPAADALCHSFSHQVIADLVESDDQSSASRRYEDIDRSFEYTVFARL